MRVRAWCIEGAAWVAAGSVLAYSVGRGRELQRDLPQVFLGAAPLVGRDPIDGWDWRFGYGLVGASLVAAALVVSVATGRWGHMSVRVVYVATAAMAGAFAVSLALTDGSDGLLRGATHESEYLVNLQVAPPPLEFLRDFVSSINRYSVHVRGHPPGFVLVLQLLDAVGLDGPWPVVGLSILGTMTMPLAVLTAVRLLAGDQWMRAVAPLLVVSPYALWMMTSADAFFTAVAAWSMAAFVVGLRSRSRSAFGWGALSGLLLGATLFLTYGGATFALALIIPWAVALRRQGRSAFHAAAGAALAVASVATTFAVLGFWWLDGARETRRQYWAGTAQLRPFGYFAVANLAVALIAIGPVGFAGLLRFFRDRRTHGVLWPLVGGGIVALLASHASQYTRAEVERIWVLFYPWMLVGAGSLLLGRRRVAASLVAVQAASAVVLQSVLVSKW